MKTLLLVTVTFLSSFSALADQALLSCSLEISNIYSVKVLKNSNTYYAVVEMEFSKKEIVAIKAREFQNKNMNMTLKDGSNLSLSFSPRSGWFARHSIGGWSDSSLTECH